ncbi:unnamed protein product [Adineta steineri]|uniref:Potassium channel domain-containing protein n=1 Tax=Adineta steineri TaxID=433720 RepID=A0A814C1E5_9BILA|nr:unnamed protein product [Adineta steineri]CAF3732400.1 unnamed protein product [Adineta steineri]
MPIDRISHLIAPVPAGNQNQNQRPSFFHTFARFLCSNLGLVIVVIAYSIGGAFLFILLEQYIELQNCQQASLTENVSVSNISETMFSYVTITSEDTTIIYEQIADYLDNFTNDVYDRKNNFRYTGQDCDTTSGWSFPSALLFTITIITSIGYGHITPVSWEGQITCICYALIGIPIFLLCLANISSILGDMFRFLYSTSLHFMCCCCRIYMRSRYRKRRLRGENSFNQQKIGYVGTGSVDPHWPEANHQYDGDKLSDEEYDIDDEIDQEMDDIWNRMESRVPILAVLIIIIGYIFFGAFIFNRFEGWTMVESVYFCYITLSTIGFGDYVPGITSSSTSGLRFVSACLYIIIGLAVLAMCIDLIKESIVEKLEWVAHKLGVLKEDENLIDDEYTRYANFQYARRHDKNGSYDEPPAYDDTSVGRPWSKDVKDRYDSPRNFQGKQDINTINNKH